MDGPGNHIYEFENFRLDAAEHLLLRDGQIIPLTPKAFETLLMLVQKSGHLVSKDELIKRIWGDTFVEEGNVAHNIWSLRKALGDGESEGTHRYIETIPKLGYRFVADVREAGAGTDLLIHRRVRTRIIHEEADESSVIPEVVAVPMLPAPAAAQPNWILRGGLILIALLLIATIVFAFYLMSRHRPAAVAAVPRSTRPHLLRLTNNPAQDQVPRWSPDGSRIAFVSNRDGKNEIYVMQSDGSDQGRLTNNQADEGSPVWSPDGRSIAFGSDRDGNWEIYVMTADGANQTRLTVDAAHDEVGTWSPDGKRIVFASNRGSSDQFNFDIWIMNSDGTELKKLTTDPEFDSEPRWSPDGNSIIFTSGRDGNFEIYNMNVDGTEQTNLTRSPKNDAGPFWSSDGATIGFHSGREGNYEIYLMNPDGTDARRLTEDASADVYVSLSPDGARVAFQSQRDGNWEIYAAEIDDVTRLTDNAADDLNPAWSLDGKHLAFSSNRSGKQNIFVMRVDDGSASQLTTTSFDDTEPSWSPDGKRIAFTSKRDGNAEVYVMNADGSNQTRLTNNLAIDYQPTWSPDNQKILFTSNREGLNLWVMDADGTNLKKLTTTGGMSPAWSADGKKILYSAYGSMKNNVRFVIFAMNADGTGAVPLAERNTNCDDSCSSTDGSTVFFVGIIDKLGDKHSLFAVGNDGKNLRRLTSVWASDRNPAVSPDGSRLAFQSNRDGNNEIYLMRVK